MRGLLTIPGLAALLATAASRCPAGAPSSANYTIEHETLDAGGGFAVAGPYRQEASAGEITGAATAGAATAKQGFTGQLWHPLLLQIDAATSVPEASVFPLGAMLQLDDGSWLRPEPGVVAWSVESGPVASISPLGQATAGRVYQATPAGIRGVLGNLSASRQVSIADVFKDDFGIYAADGIPDDWQVAYFGPDNPDAAADADPSGTGQDNLFKFTAGLDPKDPWSRFSLGIVYGPQSKWVTLRMGPCLDDRNYAVEYSLDLIHWQAADAVIRPDTGSIWTCLDSGTNLRKRFYRVVITRK